MFKKLGASIQKKNLGTKKFSKVKTKTENNDLDHVIFPAFKNIISLFVQSFIAGGNDSTRDSFDKYYMSLVEIKNFNVLIKNKSFLEQPIINKQKTY